MGWQTARIGARSPGGRTTSVADPGPPGHPADQVIPIYDLDRRWRAPVGREGQLHAGRAGPFAPDDPSGGHGNARRNQPGAVSTPRWTSLDVIAAGLPRIGGRPEPCGEARSRPDRRRCGDRSSPRLTVPTAPSGKTYLTGAPAGPQRPYPRDSQCSCNIHPRIRKVCGRNVDDLAGQASRESSDPAVSRVVRLIERSGL